MPNREITVPIRVVDQFSTPVNRFAQSMRQAEQATRQAGSAADTLNRSYGTLQNVLHGAVMGMSISGVIRLADGLYEQGRAANRAQMFFESYADRLGNTADMMERLRTVTRGTLDDTTLQNAANSLLTMGLARNGDELERLTNIGVTFAQAMGTDVSTSMENLSLLLANQSYLRLDTLGISSGEVRRLAGEYRNAGMESSEAFTAAFMDVADRMLPQMTAVADASVNAVDRLTTRIQNLQSTLAQGFATGITGGIEVVETALDVRQSRLEANAQLVRDLQAAGFYADMSIFSGGIMTNATDAEIEAAREMRVLMDALEQEIRDVNEQWAEYLLAIKEANRTPIDFDEQRQVIDAFEMRATAREIERAMAQLAMPGLNEDLHGFMSTMQVIYDRSAGGTGFASLEDVTAAQMLESEIGQLVDHIETLAGSDPINAAWVERAQSLAEFAGEMADDVERARDAYEDMTLATALGQGGDTNELLAGIFGTLDLSNLSSEQQRRLMQQFGLATGEETQASVAFQNNIATRLQALVNSGASPQAVIGQAQTYEQLLRDLQMAGVSDADIGRALGMSPDMARRQFLGSSSFTGFAHGYNFGQPSLGEIAGLSLDTAQSQAEIIDQTLANIPQYGALLGKELSGAFAQQQVLPVSIQVSEVVGLAEAIKAAMGGIAPMAGGSSFENMLVQTVQNAGGTVPGTTGRGKTTSGTGLRR